MEPINPCVDIAFKKIFGVEENKGLLISLINSVVGEEDQVTEITLLNPYNPQELRGERVLTLHIKATGKDGKWVNIEVQLNDGAHYDKKALHDWAKSYTEQLQKTSDYQQLSKAICIRFLIFTSALSIDKCHRVFKIEEDENLYFKDLELHTIELNQFCPDYNREYKDLIANINTPLDMWIAILTRHDLMDQDNLPESLNYPFLKKALHVLDTLHFKKNEREMYEGHLNLLRIEADMVQAAKERGIKKGIEEAKKRGVREFVLNMAQKMINAGYSLEQTADIVKLSIQEIQDYLAQKEKDH
ncbi:MAG: Rpn family recombination-promoting nuclease/putative transposase [Candidatus Rhabdochlamydia sp.]